MAKKKTLKLRIVKGLITCGPKECLGDLMTFGGKGTFDPVYGKVDVTPKQAERHNKVLDKARMKGLDKNCQVDQGSYAYLQQSGKDDPRSTKRVQTFIGTLISDQVVIHGKVVTFKRKGKTFRGRLQDGGCFNYTRIA